MPVGYEQAKAVLAVAYELDRLERQKALGSPWEAAGERERAAVQNQRQKADAASAAFLARLMATYADPMAAAAWDRLKGEHGTGRAGRLVEAQPEALGPLRGKTWLWGLVRDRERQAAHLAARQVVPAALARGRAWAAYAAEKPARETAERAALGRPEVVVGREAAAVLDRLKLTSAGVLKQAGEIHRAAELAEIRQLAGRAWVEAGSKAGDVRYSWNDAEHDSPEHRRREALFDKHPKEAKAALVESFGRQDPAGFTAWEATRLQAERLAKSQRQSRGRSR